jgi:cytochrome c553
MRDPASRRCAAIIAMAPMLALALTLGAADGAAAAAPPPDIAGTIHVCSSCHGPGGRSLNATFPRLAGQQKVYLETQLKNFRDHKRADPHAKTYMWGMAARLTNRMIDEIAAYYASQPPAPGIPDRSTLAAAGRQIFDNGIPSKGVPPCKVCHGDAGQGNGQFPRLAGQHRAYIEEQLHAFALNTRANNIMHENAKNLDASEIEALAAYVRTR